MRAGLRGRRRPQVNAHGPSRSNTWTHLAATYDGANVRIFVNGTQVATIAQTGAILPSTGVAAHRRQRRLGRVVPGPDRRGPDLQPRPDATEIQADMATSVGNQDTRPPTAPSGLSANGSVSSVALSWTGSTDNVGVVRYNVHRSTTQGFTPTAANRIAQPSGTSLTDSPLSPGTYYYRVTAEDAAGNISAASAEASAVVTGDTQAPTAPSNLSAIGSLSSVALAWSGSTDNVGVAALQRPPLDDAGLHAERGEPDRPADRHAVHGQPAHGGHLLLPGDRRGRGRATSARASGEASAVVTGDITPPIAAGEPRGDGLAQLGRALLVGLERQRGRRPLQPAPLDHERLHAERGQPDRAADRARRSRTARSRRRPTTTASPRRTRPGTSAPRPRRRPRSSPATSRRPRRPGRRPRWGHELGRAQRGRRRPTTWASCATTSTARPRTASRRARRTGSRSPPGTSYTDSAARARHLLLPRHRRGRRREHQRGVRAGERDRLAQPPGLVAAYALRRGQRARRPATRPGTATTGTLANATWTASGKFGSGAQLQRLERRG